jgi:chromosome segregation ATPase
MQSAKATEDLLQSRQSGIQLTLKLQSAENRADDLAAQKARLADKLASAEAGYESLDTMLKAKSASLNELEAKYSSLEQQFEDAAADLLKAQALLSSERQRAQEFEHDLAETVELLRASQADKAEALRRQGDAERLVVQLEVAVEDAWKLRKAVEAKLGKAENALLEQQQIVAIEKRRTSTLTTDVSQLSMALKENQRRFDTLDKELRRKETEWRADNDRRRHELGIEQSKSKALSQQLESLTEAASLLRETALTKAYEMETMLGSMAGAIQCRNRGHHVMNGC